MSAFLKPITDLMFSVMQFFYGLTGNYGVAIILLTVAVRVIILPLTIYQMKSMKAMQELQGPMKELQKKYKDQPEKLNQEMMQLYRTHGANPAAGCLPMLVQMPIFWALFLMLESPQATQIFLKAPPFLWMHLNQPDQYYVLGILVGGVTLLQNLLGGIGGTGMPVQGGQQKIMMWGMPILFGWIAVRFPAGIGLYYVTSTLFGVIQQGIYPGFGKRRAANLQKGAAQVETGGEKRKNNR